MANTKEYVEKNRERLLAYYKEYRKTHKQSKESRRRAKLKAEYKITPEEYDTLFINQHGRCWTCGIHQSELKQSLGIDHCHTTGIVRGLLCQPCNLMLGGAKDSIMTLQKAIEYLQRM